jgi:hypothetical protein
LVLQSCDARTVGTPDCACKFRARSDDSLFGDDYGPERPKRYRLGAQLWHTSPGFEAAICAAKVRSVHVTVGPDRRVFCSTTTVYASPVVLIEIKDAE